MWDPLDVARRLQPGEESVFQPVCWGQGGGLNPVIVCPHCSF